MHYTNIWVQDKIIIWVWSKLWIWVQDKRFIFVIMYHMAKALCTEHWYNVIPSPWNTLISNAVVIALQAKQVIITTMTMCSSSSSIVGVYTNLKGFSYANLVGSYLCGGVLTASLLVGILLYNFFIKGGFQRLQYNLILRPALFFYLHWQSCSQTLSMVYALQRRIWWKSYEIWAPWKFRR